MSNPRDAWTDFLCKKIANAHASRASDVGAQFIAPSEGVINHAPTANETARAAMSEAAWQAEVTQVALLRGWKLYHTHDSRSSEEGFPDLVMIRQSKIENPKSGPEFPQSKIENPKSKIREGRLVAAELKKMGEDPTPVQWEWLRLFKLCGAETFVWRPLDFDEMSRVLL